MIPLSYVRARTRWPAYFCAIGSSLLFLTAYVVAAQLHLRFATSLANPAPIWLPAGIGLVGLLVWGWRGLPLVALAAGAAQAPLWLADVGGTATPGWPHLLIAVTAETAQAALAYSMWRRFVPDGVQDWGAALRFVALVAIIPCILATPLMTANFMWGGVWSELPPRMVLAFASVLLLGNVLGILLVTPIYTAWSEEGWPSPRKLIYILSSLGLLLAVHIAALRFDITYIYLTVPILLLISLISGSRVASVATLLLVVATVTATVAENGPFTAAGGLTYLPLLIYLLVLVISSLIGRVQYAYVVGQQRELQQAVIKRTEELRRETAARVVAAEAALAGERRLHEQTAYQALLFNHLSDAIIATDLQLEIRSWNHAAEEIYGWHAEEVIGRYLPDVTQLQDAPGSREQLLQVLLTEGMWKGEASQLHRDGRAISINAAVALVRDAAGQPSGIVTVNRDMTEQRRAWQALERERARLAERVAERTAELQQTNSELQRAAAAKDEFLANMSHELRTPLNTVLMLTELLEMETAGPLTDKQRQHLQTLRKNGQHLLGLINDILDFSKLQVNKLTVDCTPVAVAELCSASLSLVSVQAERKQLNVALSLDPAADRVQADGQRTRQILVNLLGNAVKFTPEGGNIGLEVRADIAGKRMHFTVWDTGIGIAAQDFERLFEPFVQLDTGLARRYGGTGLGLPLSVRLARLQGGDIEVQSEVGKGSRFTLWLPWEMDEKTKR